MADGIRLWVGLGNPGADYARTRHNAGFWFIEALADAYRIPLRAEAKYKAIAGRGRIEGQEVHLLLPQTFMNRSGQSVVPYAKFFQIPLPQMLVAHDELDLPAGQIRLKTGGGHGGHNGLRDIVPHLGADFHRLRVGIGHPGHKDQVTGHVLGKAPAAEQRLLDDALTAALAVVPLLMAGEMQKAMAQLNGFKA